MELDDKNLEIATSLVANHLAEQVDTELLNTMLLEAAQQDANDQPIVFELPESLSGEMITINTTHQTNFELPTWSDGSPVWVDSDCLITTIEAVPTNAVSLFDQENGLIVEIKRSGEVTLGNNVDPRFAAHEFWTRLAEIGGEFEKQLDTLKDEIADLEGELDDAESTRLELQDIVTDIAAALGVPQLTEYDIADHAAKMKEQLEAYEADRASQKVPQEAQAPAEDPALAYERAKKVIR